MPSPNAQRALAPHLQAVIQQPPLRGIAKFGEDVMKVRRLFKAGVSCPDPVIN